MNRNRRNWQTANRKRKNRKRKNRKRTVTTLKMRVRTNEEEDGEHQTLRDSDFY